jgi:4-hydroxy-4-methyl-2-oxoglutarate aldolase
MNSTLTERYAGFYTGVVYDVLRGRGITGTVLPHALTPLDPARVLAGPAFTVRGRPVQDAEPHATLLRWTGMLSAVPPGTVLVIAGQDEDRALMGELSAETLQSRGVRGVVTDGGCRDCGFILRLGFPVVCRFRSPRDVVGAWMPEAFGEPVKIGAVTLATGDMVLSDIDGTLVVPAGIAEAVAAEAEVKMRAENHVRTAIQGGMDPQEAYLRHGVF